MTGLPRCEVIPLERVYELAFVLARSIQAAGFGPDWVVAIARGGFVPARLVCDFLQFRQLTSVGVRHYAAGARQEPTAELIQPLAVDARGQRVLVVDDVNDSGDTIAAVRAHLGGCGAAEVGVAVLHEKAGSRERADFRAAEVHGTPWLVYQWALVEDALGFLERLEPAPESWSEARRRLADECRLEADDALWEKVMAADAWRPRTRS